MSDNPVTESASTPLDENGAAAAFAALLDQPKDEEKPEAEAPQEPEAETEPEPEAKAEEQTEDDPFVTIKIDGQDVEVKLSELKNGYQRQADYTRKTMEVSEQRKAAEAEIQRARQEREQYAQGLHQTAALLQAQLAEHNNTDWQALLNSDPVEYLRQQHLYQQRQAQLQQTFTEQQKVAAIHQAEAEGQRHTFIRQQQDLLLAKLPEWKDEAKAKAEKESIRNFLTENGWSPEEIGSVSDHRAVMMARKAMLYDRMMSKAQAAAKKVEKLPQKVEKPGGGETASLDKRTSAFQKFSKSGSIEDAAAVFAQLI